MNPRAEVRAAMREAVKATIAHLFDGAPAPANPYPASQRRAIYWDYAAQQAANLAAPMREYRRAR